jgi:hypothetical protein
MMHRFGEYRPRPDRHNKMDGLGKLVDASRSRGGRLADIIGGI